MGSTVSVLLYITKLLICLVLYIVLYSGGVCYLSAHSIFLKLYFSFVYFLVVFNIDFDGYYNVRTDNLVNLDWNIFSKNVTNIYFFSLQRFVPSPSLSFNLIWQYLNYPIRLGMVVSHIFLQIFSPIFMRVTNYEMVSYYVMSRNYAFIMQN